MSKLVTLLLMLGFLVAAGPAKAQDTLYQRLGGYDAIAAVTDDFVGRIAGDEELGVFFRGDSDDTLRLTRQRIVDFICEKAGGPCYYTGRTMKVSHAGLAITAAQWDRSNALFAETLDAFGVKDQLREDVGAFIASLREDIVEAE